MQQFWQGNYCVGNEWNTTAKIKEVSVTKEGKKKTLGNYQMVGKFLFSRCFQKAS